MKIGDKVILRKFEDNPVITWVDSLSYNIGREVTVDYIDTDGTFQFNQIGWWLQSACEVVKNERYLFFSYISDGTVGDLHLKTNGDFPKHKDIREWLKKEYGLENPIITNIFEFKSEQDFLDFTSNE